MLLTLVAQATEDVILDSSADAAAGVAAAGMLGLFAFLGVIGLLTLAVWLWALIDIIRRQFTNPDDKNLWLILVIVGAFVGGPIIPIIYLIVGRKKGTIPAAPVSK